MARLFDDAQNEYLERSQTVAAGTPIAMACWFNSNDESVHQTLINLADISEDDQIINLMLLGGTKKVLAYVYSDYAETSTSWSANVWNHACSIFVSATDRRAFLNGGGKGTDSVSVTPTGLDVTSIGRRSRATPVQYMSGRIAQAAIWDLSALPGGTDSDKADYFEANILPNLAAGHSPEEFTTGLLSHWKLRSDDLDSAGSYDLTPYNTPSFADPPPMAFAVGPIAATSSVTGSLSVATELKGFSAAASGTSGSLKIATELKGSSAAVSGISGSLSIATELIGSIAAASNVTGQLGFLISLEGSSAEISSISGALKVATELKGSSAGISSIVGSLNFLPSLVNLNSSSAGISNVSGSLSIATELKGTIVAVSNVTGQLGLLISLMGSAAGISNVSGNINVSIILLSGAFTAAGNASGYLTITPDYDAVDFRWRPQNEITETLGWKTSILKAYDGTEQRIKSRQTPRQLFSLKLFLNSDKENSRFEAALHIWQKAKWLLPIWTEFVEHTATINIKDDSIIVDTTNADFRDGGKAIVWKSVTEYEVVSISTKTDSLLNLSYSMLNDFTGKKYIIPVRTAYMVSASKKEKTNSQVAIVTLVFAVYDNEELNGYAPSMIYDGIEVLSQASFMGDSHIEDSLGDIIVTDYETGIFEVESHSNFNEVSQNHLFLKDTKAACWNFRKFLHSLNGRQKTVLIPTFRNDVIQSADILATDISVDIEHINLTSNMGFNSLRTYIGFYFPSTNVLIVRKITAISEIDSDTEQISFDANLGLSVVISSGGCKICFVDKCRLASDKVQIKWQYAHRFECRTKFLRVI